MQVWSMHRLAKWGTWGVRIYGKLSIAHRAIYDMRRRPPRGGRGLKLVLDQRVAETIARRPPRGGRGLKLRRYGVGGRERPVAPHAGGVD